ncbi:MAG: hypothetical protein AAFR61_04065 [Bacteroidota bacterium]
MQVDLNMSPELERQLKASAKQAGMHLDEYVNHLLKERMGEDPTRLGPAEAALLEKINLGLPASFWHEYLGLKEKRKTFDLSPEEQLRLIALSDELEMANAQRMQHLVALSQLKKIPLPALMAELGLQGKSHG